MEYLLNVPRHVNFTMFCTQNLCNVDSAKACSSTVDGDVFIMCSQGIEELVSAQLACILDYEIVDRQGELYGSGVMFPESGCVWCMFETVCLRGALEGVGWRRFRPEVGRTFPL